MSKVDKAIKNGIVQIAEYAKLARDLADNIGRSENSHEINSIKKDMDSLQSKLFTARLQTAKSFLMTV